MNVIKVKDVLYQKMGHQWYIFMEDEGEVYYVPIPENIDPTQTPLELHQVMSLLQEEQKKKAPKRDTVPEKGRPPEEML